MFHFARAAAAVLLLSAACAVHAQKSTAQPSTHGDFVFVANSDPFTDVDRSLVYTASSTSEGRDAALSWSCMEDGLNVIYRHGKYLGGDEDDEVLVRYRIDAGTPYGPSWWGMLQGHEATWMPMSEIAAFTRQARAGGTVIFEVVDPLDGERLRDSFSLRCLGPALGRLSCAN